MCKTGKKNTSTSLAVGGAIGFRVYCGWKTAFVRDPLCGNPFVGGGQGPLPHGIQKWPSIPPVAAALSDHWAQGFLLGSLSFAPFFCAGAVSPLQGGRLADRDRAAIHGGGLILSSVKIDPWAASRQGWEVSDFGAY